LVAGKSAFVARGLATVLFAINRAAGAAHHIRAVMRRVAAASFAMAALSTVSASDQPQWGQAWSRNMVSAERGLPDRFDPGTGLNVKWTVQLGTESHSTPIVAGGHVFIGTNNGEPRDPKHQGDRGVLMCFAEEDGRFLWQLVAPKREDDPFLDWPN